MIEVQLAHKSCALALLADFGPDSPHFDWHDEEDNTSECGHTFDQFNDRLSQLIDGFQNNKGEFKGSQWGGYNDPARAALLVHINEHQQEVWGPILEGHGFKSIWSFKNWKSQRRVFIYALAKEGCE